MAEQKLHRLPLTVTPERYEIRLTPDMVAANFDGEEKGDFFMKLYRV